MQLATTRPHYAAQMQALQEAAVQVQQTAFDTIYEFKPAVR